MRVLGFCLLRYVKPRTCGRVLRLVNDHYQRIETERRGIAESMRLMADEARALEHAAANSVSNARYLMGASASTSRRESYSRIRCRSRSCRSRRGAARRGAARPASCRKRPNALSDCAWCARGRLRRMRAPLLPGNS